MRTPKIFVLAAALGLAGCGASYPQGVGAGGGTSAGGGSSGTSGTPPGGCGADGWDNYGAPFFATMCETCHQHTTEFSSVSAVVAKETLIKQYVSAGLMPQGAPLPADQQARLFAWFDCGAPAHGTGTAGFDGGAGAGATICSNPPSATTATYTGGVGDGSPDMLPGENCLACHAAGQPSASAALVQAGGTVYQSPSSGVGVGNVTVTLVDATGQTYQTTTYGSGNFYFDDSFPQLQPPFTVSITPPGGSPIYMQNPAPHGACNACHRAPPQCQAPGHIGVSPL